MQKGKQIIASPRSKPARVGFGRQSLTSRNASSFAEGPDAGGAAGPSIILAPINRDAIRGKLSGIKQE
jgi:hypothetical protein